MKRLVHHLSVVSRRRLWRLAAAAVAVVGLAGIGGADVRASADGDGPKASADTIVFSIDVAEDFSLFVPTRVKPEDTQPERGAFFVTEGFIYPAGTIPRGGTPEEPNSFQPTASGAVGKWYCRGTHLVSGALFPVTARAVNTAQLYLLPNESKSIATEGVEGAGAVVRPITGGTGLFAGYIGEQRQELIGFNASGGVNLRVTFILKKVTR